MQLNDILNNDNSKRDFFRSAAALSLATGVLGVAGTPREAMAQMRRGYTATADALRAMRWRRCLRLVFVMTQV